MITFVTSPLDYLVMRIILFGISPANLAIVSLLSSIIAFPFVLLGIRFFKKTPGTTAGKLLKSSILTAFFFLIVFYAWSSIVLKTPFPLAGLLIRGIIGGGLAGLLGLLPVKIHEKYLKDWNMPFYLEVYLLTLLTAFIAWVLLWFALII